jgi:hypothetical protein
MLLAWLLLVQGINDGNSGNLLQALTLADLLPHQAPHWRDPVWLSDFQNTNCGSHNLGRFSTLNTLGKPSHMIARTTISLANVLRWYASW